MRLSGLWDLLVLDGVCLLLFWNSGTVHASMCLYGTLGLASKRTTARIIRRSLWVLWFTGRESPERENNSPVHPATLMCLQMDPAVA